METKMKPLRSMYLLVLLIIMIQTSCDSKTEPPLQPTRDTKAEHAKIIKEIIQLDDLRNQASDNGDIETALSYISRKPGFTYHLGEQSFNGYAEFEKLLRGSYSRRASMVTKVLKRDIKVQSNHQAICYNQVQHDLILKNGRKLSAIVNYESHWEKENKIWKVIKGIESIESAK